MVLVHLQRLAARSAPSHSLIIIIAVLGGIVLLNAILLTAWCIVRCRRSKETRHIFPRMASSGSAELDKKTRKTSRRPTSSNSSRYQTPTYMQMMMSLQTTVTPRPEIPALSTYTSAPARRASVRKPPSVFIEEEVPHRSSSHLSGRFLVPGEHLEMRRMSRGFSSKRPISMDSVSVYSSASAPTDLQERIFQPMVLDSTPASAPAWASSSMGVQQSQAISRQVTTIREELAPETYSMKTQPHWKASQPSQLQWRSQRTRGRENFPSQSLDLIPPVPSLLPEQIRSTVIARPPPAALQVIPNSPPSELGYAVKESMPSMDRPVHSSDLSPDPPSIQITPPKDLRGKKDEFEDDSPTSPDISLTVFGPPPGLPPRSPLRPSTL